MRGIGARHVGRADRLHQLLAIVRELVDRVHVVVYEPDVFLRIVGTHVHRVRALHDLVPLRPLFDDVALRVDDGQAVLPTGVNAHLAIRGLCAPPEIHALRGILPRPASARKGRRRCAAPGNAANWKLNARADVRKPSDLRSWQVWQLAARNEVHAIRVLGEDALSRAPRPLVVPGKCADVLRPPLDDFVWTHVVLRSNRVGDR